MRRLLTAAAVLAPVLAMSQTPPTPPPAPCSTAHARAFDFWLGRWEVYDPKGEKAGDSRIEAVLGGCVVQEHWRGRGGVEGMSFNSTDAQGRWMQHWVDNRGGRLTLAGGLQGASMVLQTLREAGALMGAAPELDRITWTPLPGGAVRQLWEQSADGGSTWRVLFDGKYVPRL